MPAERAGSGTWLRRGFYAVGAALHVRGHRHLFARRISGAGRGDARVHPAPAPPLHGARVLAVVLALVLAVVPMPQKLYRSAGDHPDLRGDRRGLGAEPAALLAGRHQMGLAHPFGVGLRQYEAAYDQFDFLHGRYGIRRAVHSAHVQVFAELGFLGAAGLGRAVRAGRSSPACGSGRGRSTRALAPSDSKLFFTMANALLTSMAGFIVGGAFLALALNDLTWLTFGMVAALDRLSVRMCDEPAPSCAVTRHARRPASRHRAPAVPLAFRAVESLRRAEGGTAYERRRRRTALGSHRSPRTTRRPQSTPTARA